MSTPFPTMFTMTMAEAEARLDSAIDWCESMEQAAEWAAEDGEILDISDAIDLVVRSVAVVTLAGIRGER